MEQCNFASNNTPSYGLKTEHQHLADQLAIYTALHGDNHWSVIFIRAKLALAAE